MDRLLLLSLLSHVLAHTNSSNLHSLNIDECDLLPPRKLPLAWKTLHIFLGSDGSMESAEAAHLFSLLHCLLPKTDRILHHSIIPSIDNGSIELCQNCSDHESLLPNLETFR
ncbi:hypothetical protein PFISCL1PPCAC_12012, partial [Pristionchus fissidentatus]